MSSYSKNLNYDPARSKRINLNMYCCLPGLQALQVPDALITSERWREVGGGGVGPRHQGYEDFGWL